MEFLIGIISIILLIVFFVMGENIGVIKRFLKTEHRASVRLKYLTHLSAGNKKEAYEALLYIFFYELDLYTEEKKRRKEYARLQPTWEPLFVNLGYRYPEYIG